MWQGILAAGFRMFTCLEVRLCWGVQETAGLFYSWLEWGARLGLGKGVLWTSNRRLVGGREGLKQNRKAL